MSSDFESSIRTFLTEIFESNPDFNSLTMRKLREKYVVECQQNLSKEEKRLFTLIMKEFLVKYSDSIKKYEHENTENGQMDISSETGDNEDYEVNLLGNELCIDDWIAKNYTSNYAETLQSNIYENGPRSPNGQECSSENNIAIGEACVKKRNREDDSDDSDALVIDESDGCPENLHLKSCDVTSPSKSCDVTSPSKSCDVISPSKSCDVVSPSTSCDTGSDNNISLVKDMHMQPVNTINSKSSDDAESFTLNITSDMDKEQSNLENDSVVLSSCEDNTSALQESDAMENFHSLNSSVSSSGQEEDEVKNETKQIQKKRKRPAIENTKSKKRKLSKETLSSGYNLSEEVKEENSSENEARNELVQTEAKLNIDTSKVNENSSNSENDLGLGSDDVKTTPKLKSKTGRKPKAQLVAKGTKSKKLSKTILSSDDNLSKEENSFENEVKKMSLRTKTSPTEIKSKFIASSKVKMAMSKANENSSNSENDSELRIDKVKVAEEKKRKTNKKQKTQQAVKEPKNRKLPKKVSSSDDNLSKEENAFENEEEKVPAQTKTKSPIRTAAKSKLIASSKLKNTAKKANEISSNSENDSELNNDDVEATIETKGKTRRKPNTQESAKGAKNEADDKKLENLKKYIREAGIRVPSYPKLFESCPSFASKNEKLLEVLQNAGLKGNPTLAKCRKLKKEKDLKQDFEGLDRSAVIENKGRPQRSTRSAAYSNAPSSLKKEKENNSGKKSAASNDFSQIKDIVNSGSESDSPLKRPRMTPALSGKRNIRVKVSERKNVFGSDDDT